MVSDEKPVFLRTVSLVVLFIVLEVGAFIYYFIPGGISGFSVINVSDVYSKLYPSSKVFLIVQWAILTILLIFIYFKNMGIHRRNAEVTGIHLKDALSKSKTHLDALYLVLQEKKELSVRTISKLFAISPDLAIEWARILESGELVTIDYPGIGSPLVRIPEKEEVEESVKKEPIVKIRQDDKGSERSAEEKKGFSELNKSSASKKVVHSKPLKKEKVKKVKKVKKARKVKKKK